MYEFKRGSLLRVTRSCKSNPATRTETGGAEGESGRESGREGRRPNCTDAPPNPEAGAFQHAKMKGCSVLFFCECRVGVCAESKRLSSA